MPQLTERHAQARDDYDIFGSVADRLQVGEAFTEGRTGRQWLHHLYGQWRSALSQGTTGQLARPSTCGAAVAMLMT